ncbi:GNAT family N-acetyltransferase [Streptomyces microflavus]|uniref:GNAT family N-acetyltransferase n=1 Tax=Streptomyces microflavus TaxID=1919 RepID=UPI0033C61390
MAAADGVRFMPVLRAAIEDGTAASIMLAGLGAANTSAYDDAASTAFAHRPMNEALTTVCLTLAVAEHARGQGIAATLLKRTWQVYRQLGYQLLYGSYEADRDLGAFYSRNGYTVHDERRVDAESFAMEWPTKCSQASSRSVMNFLAKPCLTSVMPCRRPAP